MAKAQRATKIGTDQIRRAENIARLAASGKLEEVQAKRLARLKRNHPEKLK